MTSNCERAPELYNLSKDYERLYGLICEGHEVAAWVDNGRMSDEENNPCRDICFVCRIEPFLILIAARGIEYGHVTPGMKEKGSEESLFIKVCERCNLEWIDPHPA